ncbi:hypothetical protein APHAL10511_002302 [Amanita phalloides]|nr:hypothetical protein APHAL10511_002302 [Amanita phalloides]
MFATSQVTTIFVALVALFSVLIAAAPIALRDVYVPPVIYPGDGAVWKAGSTHNVTWNTSNPPHEITNKYGRIVLSRDRVLLLDTPLAEGFDITTGRQAVTVPKSIAPGTGYAIVLFGDSGNSGGTFTIVA